jgi:hypothetical protein
VDNLTLRSDREESPRCINTFSTAHSLPQANSRLKPITALLRSIRKGSWVVASDSTRTLCSQWMCRWPVRGFCLPFAPDFVYRNSKVATEASNRNFTTVLHRHFNAFHCHFVWILLREYNSWKTPDRQRIETFIYPAKDPQKYGLSKQPNTIDVRLSKYTNGKKRIL